MSLGELLEQYAQLLTKADQINAELREVKDKIKQTEFAILQQMDTVGVDKLATESISVTKKVELVPQVTQKEEFVRWCVENEMYEFLPSRCNAAPFRHFVEEYGEYPAGTDGYVKTSLRYRKNN